MDRFPPRGDDGRVVSLSPVRLRPGFQFFEASAKDHINVKQVFERLVDIICEKMSESLEGDSGMLGTQRNLPLPDGPAEGQGGCAC